MYKIFTSEKRYFAALLLTFTLLAFAPMIFFGQSATTFAGHTVVDVMVGGETDFDACGTTGKVYRLNPAGDNFLAVRAGPGSHHSMIHKLHTNDPVIMCDQQGDWIGIVYSIDGNDCGVSSPIAKRKAYGGVCNSGWVHKNYIKPIAG